MSDKIRRQIAGHRTKLRNRLDAFKETNLQNSGNEASVVEQHRTVKRMLFDLEEAVQDITLRLEEWQELIDSGHFDKDTETKQMKDLIDGERGIGNELALADLARSDMKFAMKEMDDKLLELRKKPAASQPQVTPGDGTPKAGAPSPRKSEPEGTPHASQPQVTPGDGTPKAGAPSPRKSEPEGKPHAAEATATPNHPARTTSVKLPIHPKITQESVRRAASTFAQTTAQNGQQQETLQARLLRNGLNAVGQQGLYAAPPHPAGPQQGMYFGQPYSAVQQGGYFAPSHTAVPQTWPSWPPPGVQTQGFTGPPQPIYLGVPHSSVPNTQPAQPANVWYAGPAAQSQPMYQSTWHSQAAQFPVHHMQNQQFSYVPQAPIASTPQPNQTNPFVDASGAPIFSPNHFSTPASPFNQQCNMAPAASPSHPQQNNPPPKAAHHIRLPKIELPTFDGNIAEWCSFWELFGVNVDSQNLDAASKMSYLIASLKGKALRAITGLTPTAANYKIAVDRVQHQFGDPERVTEAIHGELSELPACKGTSADQLRSTFEKIERLLRQLQILGEDVNHVQIARLVRAPFPADIQTEIWKVKDMYKKANLKFDTEALLRALDSEITCREDVRQNAKTTATIAVAAARKPTSSSGSSKDQQPKSGQQAPKQKASSRSKKCVFCEQEHWSSECRTHSTFQQRQARLRALNRCQTCMSKSHAAADCHARVYCKPCRAEHHRALCPPAQPADAQAPARVVAAACQAVPPQPEEELEALLLLAEVTVRADQDTRQLTATTLFDQGSQKTLVARSLVERLNAAPNGSEWLVITTVDSRVSTHKTERYLLQIRSTTGSWITVEASAMDSLADEMRMAVPDVDGTRATWTRPEILIGVDYYDEFVYGAPQKQPDGFVQYETTLGPLRCGKGRVHSFAMRIKAAAADDETNEMERLLRQQWAIESFGPADDPYLNDDDRALQSFTERITRDPDGRYSVGLPMRRNDQSNDHFGLCIGRMGSVAKQLMKKDPEIWQRYKEILDQQLKDGIIELVDLKAPTSNRVSYIPHHLIFTKKWRLVYEANAKQGTKDRSLNDDMYKGPLLLGSLTGMLMRARTTKILISADVEKAFLMIGIHESDRDMLRFVFLVDPSKPAEGDNLLVLRFRRLPFGIVAAPFILNATLRHHLETHHSELAQQIKDNVYADNVFLHAASTEDALAKCQEAKDLFAKAQMNLREFVSNDPAVNALFADPTQPLDTKLLGVPWATTADVLTVRSPDIRDAKPTKRHVAQAIASVFDPLGCTSPAVLPAKLFQRAIHPSYDWDDPLTDTHAQQWRKIADALRNRELRILRYIPSTDSRYELHVFCDASKAAYAAVAYLVGVVGDSREPQILSAKSKLTPKEGGREVTIPRCELMALHLGATIATCAEEQLAGKVISTTLWTDSAIVLGWHQSKPEAVLPLFVDNRITDIRRRGASVRHVGTDENPADIATRGSSLEALQENRLWMEGPAWLRLPPDDWPTKFPAATVAATITTLDRGCAVCPDNIRSYRSLLRAQALTHRAALKFLRRPPQSALLQAVSTSAHPVDSFSVDELNAAAVELVRAAQRERPPDKRLIKQLDLKQGQDDIWRCHGRMEHSSLSEAAKYPMFIPEGSTLSFRLVEHIHESLMHSGPKQTLAEVRQTCWIPKARQLVNRILRQCPRCRRRKARPFQQPLMAPLPAHRVSPSRPFEHTGLDYLGPFIVRNELNEKQKVWVALFTCFAVRAVHLEVVPNGTALSCLAAFRRFIARRGRPSTVTSDNAPAFKLVARTVEQAWQAPPLIKDINHLLQDHCEGQGIRWRHIVELAPWQGGVWERLVALVKEPMADAFCNHLPFDEFYTMVCEAEGKVNLRHLVDGLRPIDFLVPSGFPCPQTFLDNAAAKEIPASQEELIQSWKASGERLDAFWQKYSREYLVNLREQHSVQHRQPRSTEIREPCVGETVIIQDEMLPRNRWKLGIVEKVHESEDGCTRSVSLRTKSGRTIRRAVNQLCPLEIRPHAEPQENVTPPRIAQGNRPHTEQLTGMAPFQTTDPPQRTAQSPDQLPADHDAPPTREDDGGQGDKPAKRSERYNLRKQPAISYKGMALLALCSLPDQAAAMNSLIPGAQLPTLLEGTLQWLHLAMIVFTLLLIGYAAYMVYTVCSLLSCCCRVVHVLFAACCRKAAEIPTPANYVHRRMEFLALAALCLALAGGAQGCAVVASLAAQSESCARTGNVTSCKIEGVVRLTLRDVGQEVCIRLTTPDGHTASVLRVQLQKAHLVCQRHREFDTAAYTTTTQAVRRCPTAGSCFGDTCSSIRPADLVPELRTANDFAGNTACTNGPEWLFNGCGLPTPSCYFSRTYANVKDPTPLEVFTCHQWRPQVQLRLQLGRSPPSTLQVEQAVTHSLDFGRMTLVQVTAPLLMPAGAFITGDGLTAHIDDTLLRGIRLRCAGPYDAEAAAHACTFAPTCECRPADDTVTCACEPDPDVAAVLQKDPLPHLWQGHLLTLTKSRPALLLREAPMELELAVQDANAVAYADVQACHWVTGDIVGCFNCADGAAFDFTCTAEAATTATVTCPEVEHVVACHPNGTVSSLPTPITSTHPRMRCRVACGAATGIIDITGQVDGREAGPRHHFANQLKAATTNPSSLPYLLFGDLLLLVILAALRRECRRRRHR